MDRFSLGGDSLMILCETGKWVRYADAQARIDALEAENKRWELAHDELARQVAQGQARIEVLDREKQHYMELWTFDNVRAAVFQNGEKRACAKIDALEADCEIARMQLAGCGVAALEDTEESRAGRITTDNTFWSASYGDVCRRVDECIALRAEIAELKAAILNHVECCDPVSGDEICPLCGDLIDKCGTDDTQDCIRAR